jgi:hypothetical protein
MFSDQNLDQQIQQRTSKIKALEIQIEQLDLQTDALLSELKVTPEQLTAFISKKEHFTEENWEELVKQKQTLDNKLSTELANIRNPKKTKRNYSSLHVSRHWLHVK